MQNEMSIKMRALRPITINLNIDGRPPPATFAEGAPPKRVTSVASRETQSANERRHAERGRGCSTTGFRIDDRKITISFI